MGGIFKKGDKLILPRKYYKNIRAFIYGKNKKPFIKELDGRIKYQNFNSIKDALKKIFIDIKNGKLQNRTIFLVLARHHLTVLKILRIEDPISIN